MITEHKKRGPKPKTLVEGTYIGLPVGRDKIIVNPEDVQKLAALGCKDIEIARFFGVPIDSIRRNFHDNIIVGREEMKITLRKAMFNNACHNNNAAVQIFLAKNMLGMSDSPIDSEENKPLPWNDD
jgi:hypothetical protein